MFPWTNTVLDDHFNNIHVTNQVLISQNYLGGEGLYVNIHNYRIQNIKIASSKTYHCSEAPKNVSFPKEVKIGTGAVLWNKCLIPEN